MKGSDANHLEAPWPREIWIDIVVHEVPPFHDEHSRLSRDPDDSLLGGAGSCHDAMPSRRMKSPSGVVRKVEHRNTGTESVRISLGKDEGFGRSIRLAFGKICCGAAIPSPILGIRKSHENLPESTMENEADAIVEVRR